VAPRTSRPRIRILEQDPDLAAQLHGDAIESARQRCTAELISLPAGPVSEGLTEPDAAKYFGLVVLQGILLHQLTVAGRETVDVRGRGDLIQPWPTADEHDDLVSASRWQALQPASLAGLDRRFMQESSPWPELGIRLAARVARHTRRLSLRLAVAQIPQVPDRLQIMLWELADRFGYVDTRGVVLPLRLSHRLLAELVSSRRETVSRGLSELRSRGLVVPDPRGFRLCGTPPPLEREAPSVIRITGPGGHL
jgi:CRP/FNR family cyclic AMP-dependent transcriptional regulator